MKKRLIEFLIKTDDLGMKSIKGEVQDALKDLADSISKTQNDAKAKMHICVDQNNLEPMFQLSALCTESKELSEVISELANADVTKLKAMIAEDEERIAEKVEEPVPETKKEVKEEAKEEKPAEKKEVKSEPVKQEAPKPQPASVEANNRGKLTVSMIQKPPIALEINGTRHNLEVKSYQGLFETLLKVQSVRDTNTLREWISEWKLRGNKNISFSDGPGKLDALYLDKLKTSVNIQANNEVIIMAFLDLIEFCKLQEIYLVYFAPTK